MQQDAAVAADLIDIDTAIARHLAETGTAEPNDIEDRKQLHLQILYRKVSEHERRSP